jgi:hypothetical protein
VDSMAGVAKVQPVRDAPSGTGTAWCSWIADMWVRPRTSVTVQYCRGLVRFGMELVGMLTFDIERTLHFFLKNYREHYIISQTVPI